MLAHPDGGLRFCWRGARLDEGPVARVVLIVDVACSIRGPGRNLLDRRAVDCVYTIDLNLQPTCRSAWFPSMFGFTLGDRQVEKIICAICGLN